MIMNNILIILFNILIFSLIKKLLKKSEKNRPRFLKMDILKMSNFENLKGNVCKNVILLDNAVNSKKII